MIQAHLSRASMLHTRRFGRFSAVSCREEDLSCSRLVHSTVSLRAQGNKCHPMDQIVVSFLIRSAEDDGCRCARLTCKSIRAIKVSTSMTKRVSFAFPTRPSRRHLMDKPKPAAVTSFYAEHQKC